MRYSGGAGVACCALLVLLCMSPCCDALRKSEKAVTSNNPVADPKAVVVYGNARFTVLTEWVIRLEWVKGGSSSSSSFEDRASFAVVNRRLPVPSYKYTNDSGAAMIQTSKLTLTYTSAGGQDPFSSTNLKIVLTGADKVTATWTPGVQNTGNLLGTIRTLDGVNGGIELNCSKQTNAAQHCTYGLISTLGWNLVDESTRPLFDNDPDWAWYALRPSTSPIDWYFMGHGLNFEQALADFTAIGGAIPLPPRFAFGTWWSRYWAYSDIEFMDLVDQHEVHQVPLDVLVIDMDWHYTFYKEASQGQRDQAGQEVGWTGYTWDPNLFPNPDAFLKWAESRGLKKTLNLHPASGVQPHELRYPQMARAQGIDPSTQKYVPFNIVNKTYAKNLHNIMLSPLEKQGIDFWWLDWQQGEDWFNIPGMNPTFWLNYCFFTNPEAWDDGERPILFHRWGGLGNHRYQIGFTGDVVPSWGSLNFQPYFTATAANVAYGFWSHDIGGHTTPTPAELYTRWIQWGAFAPVLRTHTTKNAASERRIWAYPLPNFLIMRDAFVLRASMVPYTYTAARISHDTGLSMVRGLYYSWPSYAEAYQYPSEFIFGDDMVVCPVTAPGDTTTGLVQWKLWIPPGEWIEWFSGLVFKGPQVITRQFALDDIPVYVRSGSIIPLEDPRDRASLIGASKELPTTLTFSVFPTPGAPTGVTNVYEDDGLTDDYDDESSYAWTTANYTLSSDNKQIDVYVQGILSKVLPPKRNFRIVLNNVYNPANVYVDGDAVNSWSYIGDSLALEVVTGTVSTSEGVHVRVVFAYALDKALLTGLPLAFSRMAQVKTLLDSQWEAVYQEDYKSVIYSASAGQRMSFAPSTVLKEIQGFAANYSAGVQQVQQLTRLQANVQQQAVALLTSAAPITPTATLDTNSKKRILY